LVWGAVLGSAKLDCPQEKPVQREGGNPTHPWALRSTLVWTAALAVISVALYFGHSETPAVLNQFRSDVRTAYTESVRTGQWLVVGVCMVWSVCTYARTHLRTQERVHRMGNERWTSPSPSHSPLAAASAAQGFARLGVSVFFSTPLHIHKTLARIANPVGQTHTTG
jgi:hypothetical protein